MRDLFPRVALLFFSIVLVGINVSLRRRDPTRRGLLSPLLIVFSFVNIAFIIFLWLNHGGFPLHLDLMEGTVLQHLQRAAAGQFIYPEPTPAYVPLAYTPLYYVAVVPFTWLFGVNLVTLRLVAILCMLGCGLVLYAVVRERTRSVWWGLIAAGLFAAAYRTMDAYLDTAHSDGACVLMALLGSWVIDRSRSRWGNIISVVLLSLSFWFKQHGALFLIGGVLYLTWREGIRRSWPYWLVAAVLGPVLYVFVGPTLFGSHFHYFTWTVPSAWTEPRIRSFLRYGFFLTTNYPLLTAAAVSLTVWTAVVRRAQFDIWQWQFVTALLSGLQGVLDRYSSDNIFIPIGVWSILVGTIALWEWGQRHLSMRGWRPVEIALLVSFCLFAYDPRTVVVSRQAQASYADLVKTLRALDGTVYAPWLGQLNGDYIFSPAAHWAPLEDMVRGPGRSIVNSPLVRRYLEPAIAPRGNAYVLSNWPIEGWPVLAFLGDYYKIIQDFGQRFEPLRGLPRRFNHGYPRYLYRNTRRDKTVDMPSLIPKQTTIKTAS